MGLCAMPSVPGEGETAIVAQLTRQSQRSAYARRGYSSTD
jgi:hypothetical protein